MRDVEIIVEPGTGLLADPSWDAFVDASGTPFQSSRFLLPWWHHTQAANPASQLIAARVADGPETVGVCVFELAAGRLAFAGGEDVTDYMGPVAADGREKEVAALLAGWAADEAHWTAARLGGLLPADAMGRELIDAILCRIPDSRVETYDQAPGIDEACDGYLALLNSKRRSDVLRKRRLLAESVGEVHLEASTPQTLPQALDRLMKWKAAANPATAQFVAEYGPLVRDMLGGFAQDGTGQVVELCAGTRPLASAIVLNHRTTTYLYNMAYDLTLVSDSGAGLAPGVVLVSLLAEQSLGGGRRFDFLKGAQDYKLRLGGVPRDLAAVLAER